MSIRDRQRGCMYGLAVGDALGAAVEFKRPGEFAPEGCYRGFGPFNLNPGEWTDDTSMALALADSMAEGWNVYRQLQYYVNWWQTGKYSVNGRCFDIGNTTRNSLAEFANTRRTVAASDNRAAGNGSIMRLAPVSIWFYEDEALTRLAAESSSTTHSHKDCQEACSYLANVCAALIRGEERDHVLSPEGVLSKLTLGDKIRKVAEGNYKFEPPYIHGSGHVVKSLEAALWAFYKAENFEDAVLRAVNLGDDSDTTGAIAGQMAGAYWGYSGIPETLIQGLAGKDMIDKYLTPLLQEEE